MIMGGSASAGTFRLSFDGATTTVIPFDATGDQVCLLNFLIVFKIVMSYTCACT
jgi:hypothetical protein